MRTPSVSCIESRRSREAIAWREFVFSRRERCAGRRPALWDPPLRVLTPGSKSCASGSPSEVAPV